MSRIARLVAPGPRLCGVALLKTHGLQALGSQVLLEIAGADLGLPPAPQVGHVNQLT